MPRGTPRVWSYQSPPHADHNMIAGPSYAAQPIPLMSENNHKVWTWTPKTRQYHLTISHWSWTTENLELLLFLDQKTLACYRENQLPEREGDIGFWLVAGKWQLSPSVPKWEGSDKTSQSSSVNHLNRCLCSHCSHCSRCLLVSQKSLKSLSKVSQKSLKSL